LAMPPKIPVAPVFSPASAIFKLGY
jgi:hypothetical protein